MIHPTLRLDRSYRPLSVPNHFVAYQVTKRDQNTIDVTFARIRENDGDVPSYVASLNKSIPEGSPRWVSTYSAPGSVHYLRRAPQEADQYYTVTYSRASAIDPWVMSSDANALETLVRAFENLNSKPADLLG